MRISAPPVLDGSHSSRALTRRVHSRVNTDPQTQAEFRDPLVQPATPTCGAAGWIVLMGAIMRMFVPPAAFGLFLLFAIALPLSGNAAGKADQPKPNLDVPKDPPIKELM